MSDQPRGRSAPGWTGLERQFSPLVSAVYCDERLEARVLLVRPLAFDERRIAHVYPSVEAIPLQAHTAAAAVASTQAYAQSAHTAAPALRG